ERGNRMTAETCSSNKLASGEGLRRLQADGAEDFSRGMVPLHMQQDTLRAIHLAEVLQRDDRGVGRMSHSSSPLRRIQAPSALAAIASAFNDTAAFRCPTGLAAPYSVLRRPGRLPVLGFGWLVTRLGHSIAHRGLVTLGHVDTQNMGSLDAVVFR